MIAAQLIIESNVNANSTSKNDLLWADITRQAVELASASPVLADHLYTTVLQHASFADCLAHLLGDALTSAAPRDVNLDGLFLRLFQDQPDVLDAARQDLEKLEAINPACPDLLTGLLSFRGFLALQVHRLAHAKWHSGEQQLAVLIQNWAAVKYTIDIHPAARIGRRVFIDHGMGVVVGATAIIEDDVNIWHGVTLGSTLTQGGDRHPKVRRGATLCAGATVLGNIEIGEEALVAAGSIVLKNVPSRTVVAGVPARPVGSVPARLDAIDASTKRLTTA